MSELAISTSPRMTWLWAADEETARRVRAALKEAGTSGEVAQRGRERLPLVTDVGIGVIALAACEALASVGFTFTWHESEHPLNRYGWPAELPGMPRTA